MDQHSTKAFPLQIEELEWLRQIRQQLESTTAALESTSAKNKVALCEILDELPQAPKECHLEAVFNRGNTHEHDFIRLEITPETIRLGEGGYLYDATVGGSSWSKTLFAAHIDGTRQAQSGEIGALLESCFSAPYDSLDIHDHLS